MSNEVHEYLAQIPEEARGRLEFLQGLVRKYFPAAVESISYGLLAYKLNGRLLIYFGGFSKHIGLYGNPEAHEVFAQEFARYAQGKGSVQFPLAEPLPVDLITRVIMHRVETVADELPPIGRPAQAAFLELGITRISQLVTYSERELLALHGVGPKAIKILQEHEAGFLEEK